MKQTHKRIARLAMLLPIALVLSSCKETQNSNNQNANQAARKSARWVAQYRLPAADLPNAMALAPFYTSISVISPNVVFVAGDMNNPKNTDARIGVVVRTTDGGVSWTTLPIEQTGLRIERLNSLHFIDKDHGWVAGLDATEAGIVLRTTDGGASWTGVKVGFGQTPIPIFFTDEKNGWMGGATPLSEDELEGGPSSLLATTDGGTTWQAQRRLPTSLSEIFFVDKMNGWAGGHKGAIYHTTDGGRTWDTQRSELEFPEGPSEVKKRGVKKFRIRGIHFIDAQNGFAAATGEEDESGILLATTDGGAVWRTQWIVGDSGVFDAMLVSQTEGWASTNKGRYLYHTTNGGVSWLSEPVDFSQEVPIYRLGAADADHVWGVGEGAIFFRVIQQ